MSRIGKKIIDIPTGVTVGFADNTVKVKGPKGELSQTLVGNWELANDGKTLTVNPKDELTKPVRALWGLYRSLVNNMVVGVAKPFERVVDIVGIGYKAEGPTNGAVKFILGYSHPIDFKLPQGITVKIEKNTNITITGIDKALVGQVAANMRSPRKPGIYKGKGIRFAGEVIKLKAGKSGKK